MLFLNAVYFGDVVLSPMSVSTHSGFPTNISVTLFPFPEVSLIVSENDYRKEYSLKIKNGIASKSLILDEVGEYNFEIDLNYQLEDGTNKMVVHKINDFKVIIN